MQKVTFTEQYNLVNNKIDLDIRSKDLSVNMMMVVGGCCNHVQLELHDSMGSQSLHRLLTRMAMWNYKKAAALVIAHNNWQQEMDIGSSQRAAAAAVMAVAGALVLQVLVEVHQQLYL